MLIFSFIVHGEPPVTPAARQGPGEEEEVLVLFPSPSPSALLPSSQLGSFSLEQWNNWIGIYAHRRIMHKHKRIPRQCWRCVWGTTVCTQSVKRVQPWASGSAIKGGHSSFFASDSRSQDPAPSLNAPKIGGKLRRTNRDIDATYASWGTTMIASLVPMLKTQKYVHIKKCAVKPRFWASGSPIMLLVYARAGLPSGSVPVHCLGLYPQSVRFGR